MPIVGDLLKIRMKPKWRGTIIAVASLIAFHIIFYGSVDQNSSSSKILLRIFFVTGFFGGALAFVDSLRQFSAARRQMKQTGDKNDSKP